jgi:hypothetical protein
MRPESENIPDWARREREADLDGIAENLDVFHAASSLAFEEAGRGAIVVDTTIQPSPGLGHPFGYFSQEQVEKAANDDTKRMVREYDPMQEFVLVLLKPEDRTSTYRVRMPETEQTDWDFRYVQDRETAITEATEDDLQVLLASAEQLEEAGAPEVAPHVRDDTQRIMQNLTRKETPTQPQLERPDLETLIEWEATGGCEAACPQGCWVESDGTCPHGNPSWLLKLGFI